MNLYEKKVLIGLSMTLIGLFLFSLGFIFAFHYESKNNLSAFFIIIGLLGEAIAIIGAGILDKL